MSPRILFLCRRGGIFYQDKGGYVWEMHMRGLKKKREKRRGRSNKE